MELTKKEKIISELKSHLSGMKYSDPTKINLIKENSNMVLELKNEFNRLKEENNKKLEKIEFISKNININKIADYEHKIMEMQAECLHLKAYIQEIVQAKSNMKIIKNTDFHNKVSIQSKVSNKLTKENLDLKQVLKSKTTEANLINQTVIEMKKKVNGKIKQKQELENLLKENEILRHNIILAKDGKFNEIIKSSQKAQIVLNESPFKTQGQDDRAILNFEYKEYLEKIKIEEKEIDKLEYEIRNQEKENLLSKGNHIENDEISPILSSRNEERENILLNEIEEQKQLLILNLQYNKVPITKCIKNSVKLMNEDKITYSILNQALFEYPFDLDKEVDKVTDYLFYNFKGSCSQEELESKLKSWTNSFEIYNNDLNYEEILKKVF